MSKIPIGYFKTSLAIIQLAVMMYVRFPLCFRNAEDLLRDRQIDVCHEGMPHWWKLRKFKKKRSQSMKQIPQWRWHRDEVFVRINGGQHSLWRALDHEGEVLEYFVTKRWIARRLLRFSKER